MKPPLATRLRGQNQTLKDKLDAVTDERDFYIKMLARQRTIVALEQAQIDKALARAAPPKIIDERVLPPNPDYPK